MLNFNLTRSKVDPCLYHTKNLYPLVRVDDIIIMSNYRKEIEYVKKELMSKIGVRDLTNKEVIVKKEFKIRN